MLCGLATAALYVREGDSGGAVESRRTRRGWGSFLFGVAGLFVVFLLGQREAVELAGEARAARFHHALQLAEQAVDPMDRISYVRLANKEIETSPPLTIGPNDLLDIAMACLPWVTVEDVPPALRVELADHAVRVMHTAVEIAPSDFEYWLWLAP